jgi:hypothetical protein
MIDLEALKTQLAEYDPNSPKCPLQIVRHRTDHDPFSGDYDMVTYSPCCRPEGHEGECRNSRSVMGWPDFATVSALLAEIERLRVHRASSTASLLKGYETGKSEEREAVVAWLHEQAADWEGLGVDACHHEADEIERGEHRREENE